MIRHGVHPVRLDKRDYSYHGTFGATLKTEVFPASFDLDYLKICWDQVADGYPNGCTGYAQADDAGNADKAVYVPGYTYAKTCFMEGHDTTKPCSVRVSLESTQVYGLLRNNEVQDAQATTHRRGQYFNIYDDGGMDWFTSFMAALETHLVPISIVSPWFGEWETTNSGVVTRFFLYDGTPAHYPWHNWSIVGWKQIGGTTYLVGKSWQGKNYGDGGYHYLDRETMNKVMNIPGAASFVSLPYTGADIQTIRVAILETIRTFLYRIINLYTLN